MKRTFTLAEIRRVAASLLATGDERDACRFAYDATEYTRGICELIGRLRLDVGGDGEGTHENAIEEAREISAIVARAERRDQTWSRGVETDEIRRKGKGK